MLCEVKLGINMATMPNGLFKAFLDGTVTPEDIRPMPTGLASSGTIPITHWRWANWGMPSHWTITASELASGVDGPMIGPVIIELKMSCDGMPQPLLKYMHRKGWITDAQCTAIGQTTDPFSNWGGDAPQASLADVLFGKQKKSPVFHALPLTDSLEPLWPKKGATHKGHPMPLKMPTHKVEKTTHGIGSWRSSSAVDWDE